jgi:hypothetical protein
VVRPLVVIVNGDGAVEKKTIGCSQWYLKMSEKNFTSFTVTACPPALLLPGERAKNRPLDVCK